MIADHRAAKGYANSRKVKQIMLLSVLHAKIHRATVTEADLDYVGSITIDPDLTDAVGIVPGE